MKLKAHENNGVIEMVRDNYEKSLVMLAYKFLTSTYDNLDDNAVIQNSEDGSFREINKEAMRDATRRYDISIEVGSTSFDSMEEKRNNVLAQSNISLQYAEAGVPVNLEAQYKRIMATFE